MKFSVDHKSLNTALAIVSQAVAKGKDVESGLDHILVHAQGTTLRLNGRDKAMALKMAIPADVQTDGKYGIPAKLWGDLVSKSQGDTITLTVADDVATMTTAQGQYKLPILMADNYLVLPEVDGGGAEVSLTVAALMTGIDGVLVAVSHEDSKQLLQGVHMASYGDDLEFVATDGHRLSVRLAEPSHLAAGLDCTVAGTALGLLLRVLREVSDPKTTNVTVRADDLQVQFQIEGLATLIVLRLEGQYPTHRSLIPSVFERSFVVNRERMLDALGRIDLFAQLGANPSAHSICIEGHSSSIVVSAEGGEIGRGWEEIDCQVIGEPMTWHVNAKYMIDGLKSLPVEQVELLMNGPTVPVVLRAPAEQRDLSVEEAFYLLMPIQKK